MATIEERVAALEQWRSGVVNPALVTARDTLQDHAGRLSAIEGFLQRVRTAWRALARHRRAELDGTRLEPPHEHTAEEREALAWLAAERRKRARP